MIKLFHEQQRDGSHGGAKSKMDAGPVEKNDQTRVVTPAIAGMPATLKATIQDIAIVRMPATAGLLAKVGNPSTAYCMQGRQ